MPSLPRAVRDTHEPVRLPPPLPRQVTPHPRSLADTADPIVQQQWQSTLDRMERAPGADLIALRQVRSWITHGVTLDFESPPATQVFDNTFTVYQHAVEIRTRIDEYVAFGAVVRLHPTIPARSAFSRFMPSSSRLRSRDWSSTCRAT